MKIIKVICNVLFLLSIVTEHAVANEWDAKEYVESNQLQHSWANSFFFNRYDFKGNELVLDIGCGDGALTHKVAQKTSGDVVGIDISSSMVDFANSVYGNNRVKFERFSAEDRSFYSKHSGCFDLVVSFHCLHWVDDHHAVLDGIETALKPGGLAYLRFCSKGFDPIQELVNELCISEKWSGFFSDFVDPINRFGVEEYHQILSKHGLEVVDLAEYINADVLQNLSHLKNHVKGWLPHYKYLGDELGDLFLDELVEAYAIRYCVQPDSTIELPDCYLELVVTKPY